MSMLAALLGCGAQGSVADRSPVELTFTDPDEVVWSNPQAEVEQREFADPGCVGAVWSQVATNGLPGLYLWFPDMGVGSVNIEDDVLVAEWNYEGTSEARRFLFGGRLSVVSSGAERAEYELTDGQDCHPSATVSATEYLCAPQAGPVAIALEGPLDEWRGDPDEVAGETGWATDENDDPVCGGPAPGT
jgi:hypothetical protein